MEYVGVAMSQIFFSPDLVRNFNSKSKFGPDPSGLKKSSPNPDSLDQVDLEY